MKNVWGRLTGKISILAILLICGFPADLCAQDYDFQDYDFDEPKPDPTQGLYRRLTLPDEYNLLGEQDQAERIIYDASDISDLGSDRPAIIRKVIADNKVDFDEEFLFIINLTPRDTRFKNNLSALLENDSTLVFTLHFEFAYTFLSSSTRSSDFNFCIAIKKNRFHQVYVERTWFQRNKHGLKSYILRQYKDEIQQPIR